MFRLKATLVATTLMRPWRTGWSVDRGVDFSLVAPTAVAAASMARDDALAGERSCFIDEDEALPSDVAVVRRFESLNAAEAVIEPSPEETACLRVWWSMSGKPSRT